ncbi:MAG: Uma2 family endonuclease [Anaerolineae bacterium]|nr:Uma2 family endonuclease [Anaerolineae bacterium]
MVVNPANPQTGQRLTAEAFRALPENNAVVMQHIDGVMYVDSPVYAHQEILLRAAILLNAIAPHGRTVIAPMDVYLDEDTCQPDVFWVGSESACQLRPDGKWQGPPDLIIEILSPSTAVVDRRLKFDLYERQGVAEYWLVDILADAYFVEVYANRDGVYERVGVFLSGDMFPSTVLGQPIAAARILGDQAGAQSA